MSVWRKESSNTPADGLEPANNLFHAFLQSLGGFFTFGVKTLAARKRLAARGKRGPNDSAYLWLIKSPVLC